MGEREFPALQLLALVIHQSGASGIQIQDSTILSFPNDKFDVVAEENTEGVLVSLREREAARE